MGVAEPVTSRSGGREPDQARADAAWRQVLDCAVILMPAVLTCDVQPQIANSPQPGRQVIGADSRRGERRTGP
jgi:hypothetical protein